MGEEFAHVKVVLDADHFARRVHRKDGAANIDRGDAEAGAEDRADGASARHIRSASKILVGKRELIAGLQDESGGRRVGRIFVVRVVLEHDPFA